MSSTSRWVTTWCVALTVCGCDQGVGSMSGEIVNGTLAKGDPSVVALVVDDDVICSGTLVSDRVVATAAHCVAGFRRADRLSVVFGSALEPLSDLILAGQPGLFGVDTVGVLDIRVHEDFTSQTLASDIAAILLDRPVAPAPVPILRQFDDSMVGQQVRLLGFGATDAGGDSPERKRQGTARIFAYLDTTFAVEPDPSITCLGDSGGPALFTIDDTEYLAGVLSLGDCAEQSVETRVDVYAEFLDSYIAATAAGTAQPGERCFYPGNCASGLCAAATDVPTLSFCTNPCDDAADCDQPLECVGDYCRHPPASPGAVGTSCDSAYECESSEFDGSFLPGRCVSVKDGGQSVCTIDCVPGVTPCPAGLTCMDSDQPGQQACFIRGGGGTFLGGCQSGRSQPPLWLVCLVVLMWLRQLTRPTRPGRSENPRSSRMSRARRHGAR